MHEEDGQLLPAIYSAPAHLAPSPTATLLSSSQPSTAQPLQTKPPRAVGQRVFRQSPSPMFGFEMEGNADPSTYDLSTMDTAGITPASLSEGDYAANSTYLDLAPFASSDSEYEAVPLAETSFVSMD